MKHYSKMIFFALTAVLTAATASVNAQTVQINALGSSALFLEAGLAASNSSTIGASCVWSSTGKVSGEIVTATDTSVSPSAADSGQAWVAWTPGTRGSCTSISSSTKIWAYLQTDSVVGDRCLFNANIATPTCTISYPVSSDGVPTANLISTTEYALPSTIATALNNASVNAAGTDIRPEDAAFAIARATTGCGTAIGSTKYLGLGYSNGDNIKSYFGSSLFHVVNFSLPSSYSVTPIGATPVLVVINGSSTGFLNSSNTLQNISSATLAKFLDGTYSYTGQAYSGGSASGNGVTVLIREPLSGTYNTMEYNVPNTIDNSTYGITGNYTSQDVGYNQSSGQWDCPPSGTGLNPMNIVTAGGHRRRAIGTGEELKEVYDTTNNGSDVIGYGFWSAANFAGYSSSSAVNARYLTVDRIDPLFSSGHTYTGTLPYSGSSDLANVTLANVANGSYPIWSLIRLVTVNSTATTNAETLASATQNYVSFGGSSPRPDFVTNLTTYGNNITVVRSHFIPPAGSGQPTTAANGNFGLSSSNCTVTEAGGDVGGVVLSLSADSTTCATQSVQTGTTGQRR